MYLFILFICSSILIPLVIFLGAFIISFSSNLSFEKSSPFECGFDPLSNARIPFSLRFFLLAVIFLIFDIEIVLLTPAPFIFFFLNSYHSILSAFMFIMILLIGLLHEYWEGSLDWSF